MVREEILEKLQKLIAHRDSAHKIGSFGEAEAFTVKINELLLKYKLSLSEVEMHEQEQTDPMGVEIFDPTKHGVKRSKRRVWWQEQLALIVAEAHFCRVLIIRNTNALYWVGRESDRQVAVYVYSYLARVLDECSLRGVWKAQREAKLKGDPDLASGWRVSFFQGSLAGLASRFDRVRQDVEQKSQGRKVTALVRARDEVDRYCGEMFERVGRASQITGYRQYNEEGFQQGYEYGKKVSIRKGVGTSSQRKLGE